MSCSVMKNKQENTLEFEHDPVFIWFVFFFSLLANNCTFQTVKLVLEVAL